MNFASDNTSCASDKIMRAIVAANTGQAMPYGHDDWTARVESRLKEVFECDLKAFPVATGSAANALALSCITPSYGAVYCHKLSHIAVDECGAPELHTGGAKLVTLNGDAGKLTPESLARALKISGKGDVHHVQPAALSLTQLTEAGTAYSRSEIEELTEIARGYDLKVHMDGARFANALLTQNMTPAEMTWRSGIDVLSFGASKNGALAAEAVVFFDPALAKEFEFRRKRGGHLFSKQRFLSAQLDAYLDRDHWLDNAKQANEAATRLKEGLMACKTPLLHTPAGNMLFAAFRQRHVDALKGAGAVFYPWIWPWIREEIKPGIRGENKDEALSVHRLVCPFNTQDADISRFLEILSEAA